MPKQQLDLLQFTSRCARVGLRRNPAPLLAISRLEPLFRETEQGINREQNRSVIGN